MSNKKTVVFDFDGVIHSYKSGWKGETVIPDPPVVGIREAIQDIRLCGYEVCVVSTRCASEAGMKAVKAWLEKNAIAVDKVCTEKPPAVCYIDDRAICFDGHPENLLNQIIWFKPWWENTPMDVKLAEPETGLYPKYCVVNNLTGSVVEDCFVLGPKKDRAARLALLYYSDLVKIENPQLASDLKSWIMGIETEGSK